MTAQSDLVADSVDKHSMSVPAGDASRFGKNTPPHYRQVDYFNQDKLARHSLQPVFPTFLEEGIA